MSESKEIRSSKYLRRILTKADTVLLEAFFNQPGRTGGEISFKLDRSPDIWEAFSVEGRNSDIIAIIDIEKKIIAGIIAVSQKKVFIQGEKIYLGYVSNLKINPEYRGSRVSWQLLNFFREYCDSKKIIVWFYSVFTTNNIAITLFNKKYKKLPVFKHIEDSITYIFSKRYLPVHENIDDNVNVRFATKSDINNIVNFIKTEAQNKAFLPEYSKHEIGEGKGLLNKFLLSDLSIAEDQNGLCGLMGLWDQNEIRRWKVESYSNILKIFRPFINIGCFLAKLPLLPKEGKDVHYKIFSLMLIKNDEKIIFKRLFNNLMENDSGKQLYSINLLKNNSINRYFRNRSIKMNNRIYIGYWAEHESIIKNLKFDNVYIEQGAL